MPSIRAFSLLETSPGPYRGAIGRQRPVGAWPSRGGTPVHARGLLAKHFAKCTVLWLAYRPKCPLFVANGRANCPLGSTRDIPDVGSYRIYKPLAKGLPQSRLLHSLVRWGFEPFLGLRLQIP